MFRSGLPIKKGRALFQRVLPNATACLTLDCSIEHSKSSLNLSCSLRADTLKIALSPCMSQAAGFSNWRSVLHYSNFSLPGPGLSQE